MIPQTLDWHKPHDIKAIVDCLRRDYPILCSTDTIWGLLGTISEKTFLLLNTLKGGRDSKPYVILIRNSEQLPSFVALNNIDPSLKQLLNHCWPGPVTIVFKAREDLPPYLCSSSNTIALRCPAHPGLLSLLQHFDGLYSTSANRSGKPAPQTWSQIEPFLKENVQKIIADEPENLEATSLLPSTILDCTHPDRISVLREGAYPITTLEEFYGKPFIK